MIRYKITHKEEKVIYLNVTPYLYVPFTAWAIAQLIKFVLALLRGDRNLRYLYASGGMPSVHSATVCSLAMWALIDGGVASPLFGFTAVFAGIVMYDSFGVRRSSGEQARTLNKLIGDLGVSGGLRNAAEYTQLREILGHQPLEVFVGAVIGIIIAMCFGYQKIANQFPEMFGTPNPTQAKILLVFGAILVFAAPVMYWWNIKKYKKVKEAGSSLTYLALINLVMGVMLVVVALISYEEINTFLAQWFFIWIVASVWFILIAIFIYRFFHSTRSTKPEPSSRRKSDWLKKANKKKSRKK